MTSNHNSSSSTSRASVYCGIDVSKDTLDICLLREASNKPVSAQFANNCAGHRKLLAWCLAQSAHATRRFCLEATGSYSLAIAEYLHGSGEYVSVVNPAHIKYSTPDGSANKTDKAAAFQIAQYCRTHCPQAWTAPAPEMKEIIALGRHLDDLIDDRAKIKARLQDPALILSVQASLTTVLGALSQQIEQIEAQIERHIDDHPDIRRDKELLETIPGVAGKTATRLLAEMPGVSQCASAQSAAAYAGLSPKEHRSGSSVRRPTKISKAGNKHLRSCLYFPALAALRTNERVRQLAARMKAAGKSRMSIIVAAMRKLVMIAYGVLKSQRPYSEKIEKPKSQPILQSLTT